MKRRPLTVFSLSFLDCITCGLGAVILLFVIINAKTNAQRQTASTDLQADMAQLESDLLTEKKKLAMLRNALAQTEQELVTAQGLARQVLETLQQQKVELSQSDKTTLSQKAHVNKLKSDIRILEEELQRLKAGAKTDDDQGSKLRSFPGTGDRHYLTDLKMGGKRILILVDASASMLDETILGVIRRRNLSSAEKLRSPKWRRGLATVEWLTANLPLSSQFQIYTFNETAGPVVEGTRGRWLDAGDVQQLNRAVEMLHKQVPQKGTSLLKAFEAAKEMKPAPDNIFLLVDGLPTMGASKPWRKRVSSEKRLKLFKEAVGHLPPAAPLNVILYPIEGDPMAADAYWRLAKQSRGSFFCPSKDWP